MKIPPQLVMGAATSAYQIEGAHLADGKGLSTWDTFVRRPGKIHEGHTGDRACEHYTRWPDDLRIMQELGLQAYRFSIAWPRVFPTGRGTLNESGLAFYERLVDALLEAGITPWITLFHWDLPQALQDELGGWRRRETAQIFAEYAAVVTERLSDRVTHWMTINEIKCFTHRAHLIERHAPGELAPPQVAHQATHHALYGHGLATQAMRAVAQQPLQIGLVDDIWTAYPMWDEPAHMEASRRAYRDFNAPVLFPMMEGRYDAHWLAELGPDAPQFTDEEMAVIGTPVDFIGFNNYGGTPIRAADNERGYEKVPFPVMDIGASQVSFQPKAIYHLIQQNRHFFGDIPQVCAENGLGLAEDPMNEAGEVPDLLRKEYLRQHLGSCLQAIADGAPLVAYFAWSLFDNFEWSKGYSVRFGLVHVNFETQQRTIKYSGRYYAEVIRQRRLL